MSEAVATRVFGVRCGGVPLLLPEGESLEFVAEAPVYPLPLARLRVAGLTQLRGHPLVVLDSVEPGAQAAGGIRRLPVLVIGAGPDAGALRVDAPPQAVEPGRVVDGAVAPVCAFRDALLEAVGASRPAGQDGPPMLWWRFEARRLFELLAGD